MNNYKDVIVFEVNQKTIVIDSPIDSRLDQVAFMDGQAEKIYNVFNFRNEKKTISFIIKNDLLNKLMIHSTYSALIDSKIENSKCIEKNSRLKTIIEDKNLYIQEIKKYSFFKLLKFWWKNRRNENE